MTATDSQVTELLGRNRLVDELLRAGLEAALPLRDRGIDLIAYADLDSRIQSFVACPIQLKAASRESFSLDAKYARIPNLLIAYVWHVRDPQRQATFAMSYAEALAIAESMGWTETPSWQRGNYTTTRPSERLRALLASHRMTPERWWEKVLRHGVGYARHVGSAVDATRNGAGSDDDEDVAISSVDEAMGACALRIDGYRYAEDHGIDLETLVNERLASNQWDDLAVPEQLAAFFMIQRLMRWEFYVPEDGPLYRAFRTLFLRLHAEPVPERYRVDLSADGIDWDGLPPAERESWVARVRMGEAEQMADR